MKKLTSNILFLLLSASAVTAQCKLEFNAGADFVSRYIWRGSDFGQSPSIQPSLSMGIAGFEAGFWGAYTFSNNSHDADELDAWISYTVDIKNSVSLSTIVTDYYFPNAGLRYSNYNNYDNANGSGAHTIEVGLSIGGAEKFPITVAAYMNVYNDEGNNIYFQADYPVEVENVGLDFFVGGTAGSKENPGYYNSDSFTMINIGLTATKEIKISDEFSLPVFVSYILNPKVDISHLVFGISL